jgi:hypothetical protein
MHSKLGANTRNNNCLNNFLKSHLGVLSSDKTHLLQENFTIIFFKNHHTSVCLSVCLSISLPNGTHYMNNYGLVQFLATCCNLWHETWQVVGGWEGEDIISATGPKPIADLTSSNFKTLWCVWDKAWEDVKSAKLIFLWDYDSSAWEEWGENQKGPPPKKKSPLAII